MIHICKSGFSEQIPQWSNNILFRFLNKKVQEDHNNKKIKNKKQEFKSDRQKTHFVYNFYASSDSQTFQKYK